MILLVYKSLIKSSAMWLFVEFRLLSFVVERSVYVFLCFVRLLFI
uniref:Uncharacterized protein n=1 Tax=Nelumbo nucifera TaxID=4432 RepID=A0A822YQV9_NELNU|nr:TPA_asm: hypothetical protein HUJ06_012812 [Nelumbo nucifera]